jgi:hypothetical protein
MSQPVVVGWLCDPITLERLQRQTDEPRFDFVLVPSNLCSLGARFTEQTRARELARHHPFPDCGIGDADAPEHFALEK